MRQRDDERLTDVIASAEAMTCGTNLAHRYFDTAHSIVQATVDRDLPPLLAAARRLLDRMDPNGEAST